ncbi:MAG: glycosyltransferase family 2 protein [Oscillospiraceae bacterium]|nr:glycosyltransferase family 2 protein [Oscillospiraceae bacterium]
MEELKHDYKVLIIIPAYNEEGNIKQTCETIKEYDPDLSFIVINDCSTDNTAKVCAENGYKYINNIFNLGIGGAVQTGYKYAYNNGYDIAIQFDGDGQHDVNYVKDIVKPIAEGQANFVIGSRFIDDTSGFKSTAARRIGIKIISGLIGIFTFKKITDPTSGFRAANKDIIKLFAGNYPVEYPEPETIMTLIRNKYMVKEVPVIMHERTAGISSIRSWKSAYYMTNVAISIFIASIRRKRR